MLPTITPKVSGLWIGASLLTCLLVDVFFLSSPHVTYPHDASLPPIDYILIRKKARRMEVYSKKKLIKTYSIALGFQPVGHKECEGDGKTPEGLYRIASKNPKSQFYLALKISYPSFNDCFQAVLRWQWPGGSIMIHGLGQYDDSSQSQHTKRDWTLGCIAVTNTEIKEIYDATPKGTIVDIRP